MKQRVLCSGLGIKGNWNVGELSPRGRVSINSKKLLLLGLLKMVQSIKLVFWKSRNYKYVMSFPSLEALQTPSSTESPSLVTQFLFWLAVFQKKPWCSNHYQRNVVSRCLDLGPLLWDPKGEKAKRMHHSNCWETPATAVTVPLMTPRKQDHSGILHKKWKTFWKHAYGWGCEWMWVTFVWLHQIGKFNPTKFCAKNTLQVICSKKICKSV